MNDLQQQIYNSYLYASRKAQNKPFKKRKNFDNIEDDILESLNRLETMFTTYKNLNISDFFNAGFDIQSGVKYLDLNFFLTQKAKKCYTLFVKRREIADPTSSDKDLVFSTCKSSLKFIFRYCRTQKINLNQYKYMKDGAIPVILSHLKEHKVNLYTLHGLDIDYIFKECDNEMLKFMFSEEFDNVYRKTRNKFLTTKILRDYITKGLKLIDENLLPIVK